MVGIVGAVVLVSVMVGVFVYEYNNVDEQPLPDSEFHERFPTLNATGDMDCDGTPNAEDDDMDGDGTPNDEDDSSSVHQMTTGSLGPGTPANINSVSHGFCVDAGNLGGTVDVTVDPNAATPGGFEIVLTFPDGTEDVRSGIGVSFTLDADAAQGSYTVTVRTSGISPGGSVEMMSTINY